MKLFTRPAGKDAPVSERWNELSGTLALAGFEPADFEMSHSAPDEVARHLSMPDQLIMLRRRSTGHKQLYSVAPGCPWLFSAFADLTAGRFGEPHRERAGRVWR